MLYASSQTRQLLLLKMFSIVSSHLTEIMSTLDHCFKKGFYTVLKSLQKFIILSFYILENRENQKMFGFI